MFPVSVGTAHLRVQVADQQNRVSGGDGGEAQPGGGGEAQGGQRSGESRQRQARVGGGHWERKTHLNKTTTITPGVGKIIFILGQIDIISGEIGLEEENEPLQKLPDEYFYVFIK